MTAPRIVHVVHRLDYGGLENGLVNLINGLPREEWRHTVIALAGSAGFEGRFSRNDVEVIDCRKRPGNDFAAMLRVLRLLRRLKPSIVHSRNIGTLDCIGLARMAGVPIRLHGEHGWDVLDPDGRSRKYRLLRRAYGVLATSFVAVSRQIESWLTGTVGIPARKVVRICNGVDTRRFRPADRTVARERLPAPFRDNGFIVGSVTRFSEIKDPMNVALAFVALSRSLADSGIRPRLVMIGDGPLRVAVADRLATAGLQEHCWLPGNRDDIPELMQAMDVFALGSLREGISNTVLEAMASGLPVVATDTGGNPELVEPGRTGVLVPTANPELLASALARYATGESSGPAQGAAARRRVEAQFSIDAMLSGYAELYRSQCRIHGVTS